jgi:dolichol-phosphate mannosyltransferase
MAYASKYDEVIGLRSDRKNIPLVHRVGNRIISFVFSLLMGRRLSDPCSGMYLLRTEHVRSLELISSRFDVEVEIAGQTCAFGEVTEVPVSYRRRKGRGKLRTWKDGISILMTILRISWLYNPIFVFSSIAGLLAVPGLVILLRQLMLRYFYGGEAWSVGWAWFGLLLLVVGLQGVAISVISLLLKRMERRVLGLLRRGRE